MSAKPTKKLLFGGESAVSSEASAGPEPTLDMIKNTKDVKDRTPADVDMDCTPKKKMKVVQLNG